MDKIKLAWAVFDDKMPRMWKEWLVTALILLLLSYFVLSWHDRLGVILGKVPLLTIGGLLGYYGDRGLFPYARPGDLLDACDVHKQASAMTGERYAAAVSAFNTACIRRAIIVAACILGAALAA